MTLDETLRTVLFLGIEDRSGLWEIRWEREFFFKPREEQIQIAADALKQLLAQGLVRLYRCQEQDRSFHEVGEEEWERVLSDANSWGEPGPDSVSIRFETTTAGKQAYWDTES
jgi:hypothetical protein